MNQIILTATNAYGRKLAEHVLYESNSYEECAMKLKETVTADYSEVRLYADQHKVVLKELFCCVLEFDLFIRNVL